MSNQEQGKEAKKVCKHVPGALWQSGCCTESAASAETMPTDIAPSKDDQAAPMPEVAVKL
ncbi:hypothetical protein [Leptolyngbya sp. FACHB-261]|uniref:hypothetical protein n=1 Tax=Leptolyngbya sp. FACHB-261 TaxID=2692806 RepID=UPI0016850737|nr:hypothetical protein [Leptolyngbya sp. FACHB-261]MBD2104463.1 hypothetical protein [Leptolyngbya sp. FACHB-261]